MAKVKCLRIAPSPLNHYPIARLTPIALNNSDRTFHSKPKEPIAPPPFNRPSHTDRTQQQRSHLSLQY